jgi:hypothetical protein
LSHLPDLPPSVFRDRRWVELNSVHLLKHEGRTWCGRIIANGVPTTTRRPAAAIHTCETCIYVFGLYEHKK